MIYLDNNATTSMHPEVAAAIDECQRLGLANPSSQHGLGRRARRILEDAKLGIATLLGAKTTGMDADRLIITSGGTEANNLALRGCVRSASSRLLVSSIEHPSVLEVATHLANAGHPLSLIDADSNGTVRLEHLRELLTQPTALVSVMLGNNETGVLQPIREVVALCRRHFEFSGQEQGPDSHVLVHTDAVQCVGKIDVNFRELGVDALSLSAHKFHGPPGVGALLLRGELPCNPVLYGGVQQGGARPGTEPIALVVGMHRALELWHAERTAIYERLCELRDEFETELRSAYPDVIVNGASAERLPHTSNVSFPGVDRQALVMALDMAGIACSTGSACASGSSEPSPVLLAMGLGREVVEGSIRISLSAMTSRSEVHEAARRISSLVKDLNRRGNPRLVTPASPKTTASPV